MLMMRTPYRKKGPADAHDARPVAPQQCESVQLILIMLAPYRQRVQLMLLMLARWPLNRAKCPADARDARAVPSQQRKKVQLMLMMLARWPVNSAKACS